MVGGRGGSVWTVARGRNGERRQQCNRLGAGFRQMSSRTDKKETRPSEGDIRFHKKRRAGPELNTPGVLVSRRPLDLSDALFGLSVASRRCEQLCAEHTGNEAGAAGELPQEVTSGLYGEAEGAASSTSAQTLLLWAVSVSACTQTCWAPVPPRCVPV